MPLKRARALADFGDEHELWNEQITTKERRRRRLEEDVRRRRRRPAIPRRFGDDEVFERVLDYLDDLSGEAPEADPDWSSPVMLGTRLRVQAALGFRAAVVELKPGMFLVAEMPAEATRPEFGVLPLLAPLMVRAASKAIRHRAEKRAERRQITAHTPKQLPGPVADEMTWAEPDDYDAVGCDCERAK